MTTMTNTFAFAGLELRCITIEGQPWFVAADVCRILGRSNAAMVVRGLDDAEHATITRSDVGMPRGPHLHIVSESGLYTLVMRAQRANPKAVEFQNWVTGTVLPAIRQTGGYIQGEEKLAPTVSEIEGEPRALDTDLAKAPLQPLPTTTVKRAITLPITVIDNEVSKSKLTLV